MKGLTEREAERLAGLLWGETGIKSNVIKASSAPVVMENVRYVTGYVIVFTYKGRRLTTASADFVEAIVTLEGGRV